MISIGNSNRQQYKDTFGNFINAFKYNLKLEWAEKRAGVVQDFYIANVDFRHL